MEDILEQEDCRGRLPSAARRALILWRQWRRAAADKERLLAMDSHARRDIGVTAADIEEAVRMPWWRWPV